MGGVAGVKLYSPDTYSDGVSLYNGYVSFSFSLTDNSYSTINSETVKVDASYEVIYLTMQPNVFLY